MESTFSEIDENISLLKQLRDAAMVEPDSEKQEVLRFFADELQVFIKSAHYHPTLATLQKINSLTAGAVRVYKNRTPQNSPSGGAMPAPEAQMRKAA